MAANTKQVSGDQKATTTNEEDKNLDANVPDSARTNGELDGSTVREPQVGEAVKTSFDERTGTQQPWLMKDGVQDNGLRDPSEAEGARASANREGDNTTVEETDQAIKDGKVEGPQLTADDAANEKPKNPVK